MAQGAAHDRDAAAARDDAQPNVVAAQSLPFLFAIALGIALLPVQETPIDPVMLVFALAAISVVVSLGWAVVRVERTPPWVMHVVPYLYLLSIGLLREATGSARSGYVALLFLAPFWVALHGTRRQVVLVTIVMFIEQAGHTALDPHVAPGVAVRGALLLTLVIGMMSLAVQRSVSALRDASERLARSAAARARANEELAATNAALASSNRDLEQFAYVSSHDLQEPLRMIRSFSQLFMQRHATELDDDGRELLGFVVDGAERAQSLVADLLDYSRVGTSERPFEDVDLGDIVERALDVLGPTIEESDGRVFRPDSLPRVHGDPTQLERLVVNVVGNAIKYRSPDRPLEIRIDAARMGNMVRVDVTDNGIGFDEEHAQRIFKMFQRLHARGEYDGTGIGLAICARIVERHGGEITAQGVPGEGSRFSFTLEAAA